MFTEDPYHRVKVALCLFLVSASWGSCYLFIELALRSFPTFFLTGARLGLAGCLLFVILWLLGNRKMPTCGDLKRAFIVSFFMVYIGAGTMTIGQNYVPSGIVAMTMGSTPLWMVIAGWIFLKERRPTLQQTFGLLLGTGSVLLLGFRQGSTDGASAFGMLCLAMSIAGWVAGSLYSKAHEHDTELSLLQTTSLMLLCGALQCLVTSVVLQEEFCFAEVTMLSWFSLAALVLLGGITAYSSYFWLLSHTSTAVAISYDYVNPVVGILLGWIVTGEPIDSVKIAICFSIITALFFVIAERR